jgi:hypothetical protein
VLVNRDAVWRNEPPTAKQMQYLKKYGVPLGPVTTKGQASFILDRIFSTNPKPVNKGWEQVQKWKRGNPRNF